MGEWKRIKLSEVLKEKTERNRNNETDLVLSVTNSQGFVKQSDFFEGTVHSEDISNYKLVRKNEFAYNPSRINVGSIDILKEYDIGALSPMYVIFSVEETRLLPDYFKYYFQTHRFNENVKNNTQGSVRNSLSFKALSEFEYLLPPLEEQKRIVKILDQVNKIIEKYQNLINEKEQFIKSQFVGMFGDLSSNSKEYEVVKLSDIAKYWNGLTYSPTNISENGTIVLRSSNIKNNKLDFKDIVKVNCDIKDKNVVKENDILMCSRNGSANLVGKVAMIESFTEPMCFGAFMMIIRSKYFKYLFYYFQNDAFRKNISLETTTQINQITANMLDKIRIPLPSDDEIETYGKIVELIDKQKFHSVLKNIIKVKESEVYA